MKIDIMFHNEDFISLDRDNLILDINGEVAEGPEMFLATIFTEYKSRDIYVNTKTGKISLRKLEKE